MAPVILLAITAGVKASPELIFQGVISAEKSKITKSNNPPGRKTATACTVGTNLIINPDAETDTEAIGDGSADQDVTAWENETGEFTVVRYDAPGGFPTSTGPGPANRGTFFFGAGFAETSSASQVIDISGCSSQIDSGTQPFILSGFLGGFGPQNDSPRVVLTFKNTANAPIGTASIGPVTATERNNVTGLIERESIGIVPVGTRSVGVLLQIIRNQGVYNDGYADHLSFILAIPPTCSPLPSGALSWWKAEGDANDVLGANNGVLHNGVTFGTGLVNQAFSFDGINDFVSVNNTIGDDFSIEFWVRSTTTSLTGTQCFQGNGLVWSDVAGEHNDWTVAILNNKACFLTGNPATSILSTTDINDGSWHHVAVTRAKGSVKKLYVDGGLQASGPTNSNTLLDNPSIGIGGNILDSRYFKGSMDEVTFYNRVLSDTEVQAIFSTGITGKCGPGSIQSLVFNPNPVNGGQSSTGTVTLTTAAPAGGTVFNLSSNTNVATVPPSVTITAGQTAGTFAVTTSVLASDTTALITASNQSGATSANLTVLAPKPDLAVTSASVPASAQTDAAFNISWTVKNQGQARAIAPWTDRVFLSTDNQLGNDILVGEFPFSSDLDPNQTADRIQTLTISRNAISQDGSYFLLIQTDANNQINEGINEDNNVVPRPINITRPPRPDLVVDSIVAPNTAFFGQTISVQWTVKNNGGGPTNAQGWQDFVYLSVDNVPEIEDPFKIPVANVSYLSAGESYTATADVKIPQGLVGQYKIVVWTDGDGTNHRSNSFPHQVIEDNEENNYGIARPIQINAPPLPDLQTASVVAPEDVFAGGQMTLTWRVENHGDGVTPSDQTTWLDKIYLSQDTTLNVNTDRLVGSRSRSGALAPNEGYTVTNFNSTLPNDIAGDWFVFILADGDNQVYEFNNESNNANYDNQSPGSPMHIHATPPDLVIPTPLNAPATASNGQTLSVSWTAKNQGAFDAAPNWFDAVYLSADQTLNTASDTLLTSVFRSGSLGPGLTYDVTANVTVPPCISGTYYLFVLTDSRGQIFEFDPNLNAEANNSSQPRSIQIADATPDLRVTALSNPATGSAGQPIGVSWTVANQGAGATGSAKWTDRIFFSPTQAFDSSTALLIGSFDHTGALNSGANYTRTENLTIPNTAQGSYFVIVLTDANNEVEECSNNANNIGVGSQSIAISNSLPDLVVQTASSQSGAVGGQTISVNWTVVNQGTAAANNASWGDAVYFSSDAVLDINDLRLATAPASGPLAIGAPYNRQVQVTLPVVSPGNYFLIVQADYLGNVFEGQHEDNNLRIVALTIQVPAVDLMVTTVDAPATAFSGQAMTVSWTVLNNGSNPTIGSHWIDEVVLSLDQNDDPTDPVIGSKQHNGVLNSQTGYNDSLSVFVPQGFTGQYYVFVRTDGRNEVAESNESNNSAADGIVFSLTPPADLIVSSITPPSSGSPGDSITVNWTIQNSGTNPATGSWDDAVYLSSDQTWDIGDILIGKRTQAGPLATGQSYNGQLTATLPAINPGSYYIVVKTDVQNRVRETNENNNTGAAGTQTSIDVTALQIGVPINTTLLTGQERYYKTNAPANETVRFALDGQTGSANELFARFGLIAGRNSFDFLFSLPNEANQEILVPNSQASNYFTLARSAFSTPSPESVTIKAEVIPFGITSVSPDHIGDNGQVTITIKGARFEAGATVQLVHGGTTLNAVNVIRVDSSTVKARFIFTNAPRGLYDVILTNPGGQMTTQSGAVTIEQAQLAQPTIISAGDLSARPLRSVGFYNQVSNGGNVDIQYVAVRVQVFRPNSSDQVIIVNNRPDTSLPRKVDFPMVDWNNAPLTNTKLGNLTTDTFLYRDLTPGEMISYNTEIRGLNLDRSYISSQVVGLTREEMIGGLREVMEIVRQEIINRGILAQNIDTAHEWWDNVVEPFLKLNGFIDGLAEDDISTWRLGIRSAVRSAIETVAADTLTSACNTIVDGTVTDCGLKCVAKLGCCNINTIASTAAALEYLSIGGPVGVPFGILEGVDGLLNAAKCLKDGINCANNCPQPPPPPCVMQGNANNQEFTQACIKNSRDPNEKLSSAGYGEPRFVAIQQDIPYTINFENVSTATAYAQRVRITDQLDPNLDPRTLRLREIGFKQYRFQVPDNRAFFQQRVQLGSDLGNLLADISAGVDISTGTVTWTLTAIDPATGEQPNGTNLGLLPPNNDTNDGQGFVTFTIKPKSTTTTGAVINNGATIIFDTEAPINTNTVSNTVDAQAPSSAVDSLAATQSSPTFNVSWSGSDAPSGSGLLNYDIYYSANDGPYQVSVSGTTATSTEFIGQANTTYRFYSIARDNSGNVEAAPASADATTTVGTPAPNPPTATAATSVTSSSFTSNWSSSSGATGYRLDLSTDSSFNSYVSGYQDLDVGNVLSRSVTGLSASTPHYYRVRAYNAGATGGNSNTVSVTTSCIPSLSSSSQSFPREGGTGTVDVTASVSCGWSAASNDSWITITSGPSGLGNGTVNYSVALNTGPARTGTMTIAAQTFTVTQDSGCTFMLGSMSQNFVAAGGMNSVNVITAADCAWAAVSKDAFILVTSGSSGSGNGTVNYSVAVNTGPARMGTMTIAGVTFTVTQDSGCTFTLDRDHQSFAVSGGTGTINVTASDGACPWAATTTSAFITITSGGSGTGSGAVQYTVAINGGSSIRNDTLTIAGHTFTVYQGIGFLDVPSNNPFHTEIGKLSARGVTLGCGNGNFCPNDPVTREQMAAFIMRAKGEFNPPTPGSQRFNDVPSQNVFYNFIDRLAVLQITLGCTSDHLFYCPTDPVKREQMAAFLLRGLGEFNPPTPTSQRFNDVPLQSVFYNFIDRLAVLQITLGCTPDHLMYCPNDSVTRAQMAAFLVRAFNL